MNDLFVVYILRKGCAPVIFSNLAKARIRNVIFVYALLYEELAARAYQSTLFHLFRIFYVPTKLRKTSILALFVYCIQSLLDYTHFSLFLRLLQPPSPFPMPQPQTSQKTVALFPKIRYLLAWRISDVDSTTHTHQSLTNHLSL